TLLEEFYVRDKQVVAYELDSIAQPVGEFLPILPVALGTTIFDRDDRILRPQLRVKVHKLVASQFAPRALLKDVNIPGLVIELRAGDIKRQENLLARLVARVFRGLE